MKAKPKILAPVAPVEVSPEHINVHGATFVGVIQRNTLVVANAVMHFDRFVCFAVFSSALPPVSVCRITTLYSTCTDGVFTRVWSQPTGLI